MCLGWFGTYNNWWFYLHHLDDIPSGYDWNGIQLEKNSWTTVDFTLISYYLLKSPYPTNCLDYSQTQWLSRTDCIRKCKINESLAKCGLLYHQMDVYKNEPNVRFAVTDDQIKCINDLKLKDKCFKICPKYDCFKQQFVQKVISKVIEKENQSILSLAFSTVPQISHYHKPKLETIEFLCYLASIVSLWFGFSMISTYDWLKIIITKINQSTKIKVINNQNFIFQKR